MTTCPRCQSPLSRVVVPQPVPPWKCSPCARSWWDCETTTAAAAAYRPGIDDFYYRSEIPAQRRVEHELATMRGCSTIQSQISSLTDAEAAIVSAAANPKNTTFHAALAARH
jgi:hypothetical protein